MFRSLLTSLALMVVASEAAALDPSKELSQLRVGFWKDTSGLPQNFVNALYQTRDGYLWVGTKGGLARFDGVRFEIYDDLHPNELKEAEVWAIAEAPDGSVWIGTYGGGLSHLVNGRFETLTTDDGLPSNQIEHLLQGPDGKLWIATLGGLASRDPDGKITSFGVADGLPGKAIFALHLDEDGTLWIGTEGGLASFSEGRFTNHAALHSPLLGRPVSAIVGSSKEGLWLGLSMGGGQAFGLCRYRAGQVTHFTTRDGLPSDLVTSLAIDGQGTLWIGTLGGLSRYRSGRFDSYSGDTTVSSHGTVMSLRRIEALFVDREDNLWVGTRADGLARLWDSQFTSFTAGLTSDFNSVMEDRQGGMWIGSEVGFRHLVGSRVESFALPTGITAGCLAEDHAGVVWIGTQQGVFKVQAGVLSRVTLGALDQLAVTVLFVDLSGHLWIGMRQGGLFELSEGKLRHLGAAEGLLGEQVRAIAQDAKGALWVGTRDGGVSIFREGGIKTIGTREGLASPTAQSIWVDADGVGWVSTRKGLARVRDDQVTTITTRHGLPANYFYQIIEDDSSHLWLTHARGVVRVARSELNEVADGRAAPLHVTTFGTDSGLCSTTMTVSIQPSAWKRRNGDLWFATARCVAVIAPRSLATRTVVPPAHIEQITVDGRIEVARDGLTFPPGRGDIEIRYTGFSFVSPETMVFRYRLDSTGQGWVDAGTRRIAFFTSTPPGLHRFEVVACHTGGECEGKAAILPFRIEPHFYQTWPFRTLLGALLLGTAFQVYRSRVAAARATLGRVTRELAERTEAEATLRSLNAELRLALESGRMGTWFWSAQTGVLSWSPEVHRITNGLTSSFDGGLPEFLAFVHVDDRQTFDRSVAQALVSSETAAEIRGPSRSSRRRGSLVRVSRPGARGRLRARRCRRHRRRRRRPAAGGAGPRGAREGAGGAQCRARAIHLHGLPRPEEPPHHHSWIPRVPRGRRAGRTGGESQG